MNAERIHLTVDAARALSEAALRRIGYDARGAGIIADHVLDAALCGYEYAGLPKILSIPEHPRFNAARRPMTVLHQTAVSTLYDGGNNLGMLAIHDAACTAIEQAQARGFAVVGVTDTWYSGRCAYFVEMIARAGLVGISTSSSWPFVAAMGGAHAVLGTNPIAFGIPGANGPLSFDMGTAAFMGTELLLRERLGQPLPAGVALDAQGRPTIDPAAVLQGGALLPFGGHKGFGLSFIVQALGLLTNPAPLPHNDDGYVFIVFRPDLLMPLELFQQQAAELLERVKGVPRQPGVEQIRIPSERAARTRERLRVEGIEIDRLVYDALLALRRDGTATP